MNQNEWILEFDRLMHEAEKMSLSIAEVENAVGRSMDYHRWQIRMRKEEGNDLPGEEE